MKSIPLLLIPVLLAHGLILAGTGIDATWLTLPLPSGVGFVLTGGTTILAVGLVTLFAEVFKASGATRASLMDQMLSLLLFIVVLLEFLLWPAAGNSVFALLGLMTLVDVIAGFAVGMAVARRDVGIIRE
jgi:hypothetical protein